MDINELLLEVLSYLDVYELISCFSVCKRWKQLCLNDMLWKPMLSLDDNNANSLPYRPSLPEEFKSYYEYYRHVNIQIHRHQHDTSTIYYLTEEVCPLVLNGQNLLDIDYIAECDIEEVNNAISVILPHFPNIRRGDLVVYPRINFGIFIYDGKKMEVLDYKSHPDSIGLIPASYSIPDEFPINYWSNYGYWDKLPFHPELYIDAMLQNYTSGDDEYDYTWFECNYMIFHVVITDHIPKSERKEVLLTSSYTECEEGCNSFRDCMTLYVIRDY